jgi:hypothetical protein
MDKCSAVLFDQRAWRSLKALGDCVMIISRILSIPCGEIHLYQRNKRGVWQEQFLDLLKIMKGSERVTIHKVGEMPTDDFINITGEPSQFNFPNQKHPDTYYSKIDFNKVPYNSKVLDSIDFNKTICWSARYGMRKRNSGGKITPKEDWENQFAKVPECVLNKYPDYNYINLGMSLPINYDLNAKDPLKPGQYDINTSAWVMKKSYKYVGIDSGGTHLALAIKDPRDIIFYDGALCNQNREQRNPAVVKRFKEVGMIFMDDD